MKTKVTSSLLLLLTAAIWGFSFVAQSVGAGVVGAFTFNCFRMLLAGIVTLPVVMFMRKKRTYASDAAKRTENKATWKGGIIVGILYGLAMGMQQMGMAYTTVGKAGFITACYIVIVPVIGIFLGKKSNIFIWGSVFVAVAGLYLLCMNESFSISKGDAIVCIGALLFAIQILAIDRYVAHADGVALSCIQFFVASLLSGGIMLLFETVSFDALIMAWKPILYTGVLSSGVAGTLQIVAQRGLSPTIASLIMSLESVLATLAGWLLLHQTLTLREGIGCALIFIAIVAAQVFDGNTQVPEDAPA